MIPKLDRILREKAHTHYSYMVKQLSGIISNMPTVSLANFKLRLLLKQAQYLEFTRRYEDVQRTYAEAYKLLIAVLDVRGLYGAALPFPLTSIIAADLQNPRSESAGRADYL